MIVRLLISLLLGGLMGFERELVGKEAGVRTAMLVASGATIFTMIAMILPFIISGGNQTLMEEVLARNSGALAVIANIVVGIGFLGAGIIIKTGEHVRGLTTAAVVWTTAAIGVLVGLGLSQFATAATLIIVTLLYILRKIQIDQRIQPKS